MLYTINLPPKLYEAVNRQADKLQKTADDLIAEWVAERLATSKSDEPPTTFEQEAAAFEQLKPALLKQYAGQYVAIYQGRVVASGGDKFELLRQVYKTFGEIPCYIDMVSTEPPRRVRMPSFRVVRK